MIKTRQADPNKPYRIMVYGPEGVGKSTLGAKAERPIFIAAEGGSDQLTDRNGVPVHELEGVKTWDEMMNAVASLAKEKHDFKTLVLDSADWLEALAHKKILKDFPGKTITTVSGGYGSGYRQTQNMFQELIAQLSGLRESRGMNIIFTAHSHVKPVKDPDAIEDYDAYEIKCHELVSSALREWVDALFFVRFKTHVKGSSDEKSRARAFGDDERILYTVKRPAFQAKNRYGIPSEMSFGLNVWDHIMPYISKGEVALLPADLDEIIADLSMKVSPDVQEKVKGALVAAADDTNKKMAIVKRLRDLTNTHAEA